LLGVLPLIGFALALRFLWEPGSLWLVFLHFGFCALVYLASVWLITFNASDRVRALELLASVRRQYRTVLMPEPIS